MPTKTTTANKTTRTPRKRAQGAPGKRKIAHTEYNEAVWERAKTRADDEGRAMPDVLRGLLADYANGR